MNKVLIIFSLVFLVSCGPSQEERENVAAVTCSIKDGTVGVEKINESREKIGETPFLGDDAAIQEAFEWGLCQELVLNENYDKSLQSLKDEKQERERIAAEKLAEEKRIAAENQRIADSKPSVKESFHSTGKLQSRINYQPKSGGGKQHGLSEWYYDSGQLKSKFNYKDGRVDGLAEIYFENGQLMTKLNHKDGRKDGLFESYDQDGKSQSKECYRKGGIANMSYCEK